MKKTNDVLIFLISLTSICFAVRDFNLGLYDRLIASLTISIVFLFPRIIKKLFKIKISSYLEFIYIIFIILAQFLGSVVNLYNTVWWYDLFVHFLSGVLTAVLALVFLDWFSMYKENNTVFNILFIIIFSVSVAGFWELFEYGADTLLGMNVQHSIETGVKDTMGDILVATLGSIVISILYLFKMKTFKKIVSSKN